MKRRTLLAAGGATLVLGGAFALNLSSPQNGLLVAHGQRARRDTPADPSARSPDMVIGIADAPVKIIEYASFTCPHCAEFHDTVWPQLKAELHRHRQGAVHLPRGLFRPLRPLGRDDRPLRRADALLRHRRHALRQAARLDCRRRSRGHRAEPAQAGQDRRADGRDAGHLPERRDHGAERWSPGTRRTPRRTTSRPRRRS